MRGLKLIVFGVLGLLGLLRGAEPLLVARSVEEAVVPLALGAAFTALFVRAWKDKPAE